MLTYQIRERIFRADSELEFPNDVELNIYFHPDTALGNAGAAGRTWKQSTPGRVVFNANTGHFTIEPKNSLLPLDVIIQHRNMSFKLNGNHLRITTYCESNGKLTELIESLYYVFPYVLSLGLRDAITVDRVDGKVGSEKFRWELNSLNLPILISNQKKQEDHIVKAWELMDFVSSKENRRIIAALRYYYTACRLRRVGKLPWEFMGEIIVNLCKVLEALFPATRDSVREGLSNLGYLEDEIEDYFIPIMLLRSKIDSGHVFLALFTRSDLNSLHSFTDIVEEKFHEMLNRLILKLKREEVEIKDYKLTSADKEAKDIIQSIQNTIQKNVFLKDAST